MVKLDGEEIVVHSSSANFLGLSSTESLFPAKKVAIFPHICKYQLFGVLKGYTYSNEEADTFFLLSNNSDAVFCSSSLFSLPLADSSTFCNLASYTSSSMLLLASKISSPLLSSSTTSFSPIHSVDVSSSYPTSSSSTSSCTFSSSFESVQKNLKFFNDKAESDDISGIKCLPSESLNKEEENMQISVTGHFHNFSVEEVCEKICGLNKSEEEKEMEQTASTSSTAISSASLTSSYLFNEKNIGKITKSSAINFTPSNNVLEGRTSSNLGDDDTKDASLSCIRSPKVSELSLKTNLSDETNIISENVSNKDYDESSEDLKNSSGLNSLNFEHKNRDNNFFMCNNFDNQKIVCTNVTNFSPSSLIYERIPNKVSNSDDSDNCVYDASIIENINEADHQEVDLSVVRRFHNPKSTRKNFSDLKELKRVMYASHHSFSSESFENESSCSTVLTESAIGDEGPIKDNICHDERQQNEYLNSRQSNSTKKSSKKIDEDQVVSIKKRKRDVYHCYKNSDKAGSPMIYPTTQNDEPNKFYGQQHEIYSNCEPHKSSSFSKCNPTPFRLTPEILSQLDTTGSFTSTPGSIVDTMEYTSVTALDSPFTPTRFSGSISHNGGCHSPTPSSSADDFLWLVKEQARRLRYASSGKKKSSKINTNDGPNNGTHSGLNSNPAVVVDGSVVTAPAIRGSSINDDGLLSVDVGNVGDTNFDVWNMENLSDDGAGTISSGASIRGVCNQEILSNTETRNMCDNPSDMWHGLKTQDGKPVVIRGQNAVSRRNSFRATGNFLCSSRSRSFRRKYRRNKEIKQLICKVGGKNDVSGDGFGVGYANDTMLGGKQPGKFWPGSSGISYNNNGVVSCYNHNYGNFRRNAHLHSHTNSFFPPPPPPPWDPSCSVYNGTKNTATKLQKLDTSSIRMNSNKYINGVSNPFQRYQSTPSASEAMSSDQYAPYLMAVTRQSSTTIPSSKADPGRNCHYALQGVNHGRSQSFSAVSCSAAIFERSSSKERNAPCFTKGSLEGVSIRAPRSDKMYDKLVAGNSARSSNNLHGFTPQTWGPAPSDVYYPVSKFSASCYRNFKNASSLPGSLPAQMVGKSGESGSDLPKALLRSGEPVYLHYLKDARQCHESVHAVGSYMLPTPRRGSYHRSITDRTSSMVKLTPSINQGNFYFNPRPPFSVVPPLPQWATQRFRNGNSNKGGNIISSGLLHPHTSHMRPPSVSKSNQKFGNSRKTGSTISNCTSNTNLNAGPSSSSVKGGNPYPQNSFPASRRRLPNNFPSGENQLSGEVPMSKSESSKTSTSSSNPTGCCKIRALSSPRTFFNDSLASDSGCTLQVSMGNKGNFSYISTQAPAAVTQNSIMKSASSALVSSQKSSAQISGHSVPLHLHNNQSIARPLKLIKFSDSNQMNVGKTGPPLSVQPSIIHSSNICGTQNLRVKYKNRRKKNKNKKEASRLKLNCQESSSQPCIPCVSNTITAEETPRVNPCGSSVVEKITQLVSKSNDASESQIDSELHLKSLSVVDETPSCSSGVKNSASTVVAYENSRWCSRKSMNDASRMNSGNNYPSVSKNINNKSKVWIKGKKKNKRFKIREKKESLGKNSSMNNISEDAASITPAYIASTPVYKSSTELPGVELGPPSSPSQGTHKSSSNHLNLHTHLPLSQIEERVEGVFSPNMEETSVAG